MPTTFVFMDVHGNIGQMSAPQRSSGRPVPRRIPKSPGAAPSLNQPRIPDGARAPLSAQNTAPATLAAMPPPPPAQRVPAPVTPAGVALPPGPHPVELAGLLHELSAHLLGADDVTHALDRLAGFTASVLPGVLRCSVTLIGEGGPPALAVSGPRAQALDDLQHTSGEGPSLEAARTRSVVTAPELQSDSRWPELAEEARAEGVHGIVSIPMDVQRSSVGSLSFFVGEAGGIDPELLLTAMAMVNQAEVMLGELRRREGLREGAAVDRAAGVIIAQRGCGVQEAYDVLRETAQRLGLDRRTVAERLITAAARNAAARPAETF